MFTRTCLGFFSNSNPFLASDDFCRLLITFANSLDPDQDQQIVGPDLYPTCLTLLKDFFEKVNFDTSQQRQQNPKKYPACKELAV